MLIHLPALVVSLSFKNSCHLSLSLYVYLSLSLSYFLCLCLIRQINADEWHHRLHNIILGRLLALLIVLAELMERLRSCHVACRG